MWDSNQTSGGSTAVAAERIRSKAWPSGLGTNSTSVEAEGEALCTAASETEEQLHERRAL